VAKGKRRVRDEVIYASVFIVIILLTLVLDWWKEHAVIGWVIVGIMIIFFLFSLYRFPAFRGWVVKKGVSASKKAVFTDETPGREPIPRNLYNRIMQHANNRCQNPDCRYQGKPVIYHINQDRNDDRFWNLIALCPNCHNHAHAGKFSFSQLRNWHKMKRNPRSN
jgi:hypothetical protein